MKKTLIILGAGASKDFCRIFPTGLELIKEINYHFLTEKKYPEVTKQHGIYLSAMMNSISHAFENKHDLFRKIKNQLWNVQLNYEYEVLRNNLANSISIDNFIATKIKEGELDQSAADIIKYSIYYLIKGTELALFKGQHNLTNNWISELTKKLSYFDLETIIENLTVVTFNYDRVFEKYYVEFLNKTMHLDADLITTIQNSIIHVYGSLGDLKEIPFDLDNQEARTIKNNYTNIKLIDDRNDIKLNLQNANEFKKVHFIGFGYDEANLQVVNLDQFTSASFYGTAYYYSDLQIKELKEKYNINATNISCRDYFQSLIF